MNDIISREILGSDLKQVVNKLIPDSIGKDIEKACQGIYPLHEVHIRKVRILLIKIFKKVTFARLRNV